MAFPLLRKQAFAAIEPNERGELMGVYVQWDSDEKRVVIWTLVGRWSWNEFQAAWEMMHSMLASIEHKVDFIYDVRHMSMLPADTITRLKGNYLNLPSKVGHLLAVGVDTNLRLFWNTFTDLPYANHLKMTYFDTLEDAIAYVQTGKGNAR